MQYFKACNSVFRFFVYSQGCAVVTTVSFQNIFIPPEETLLLAVSPYSPLPPLLATASRPSASSGHSHKGIIQYLGFCVWLLSLSLMLSRFIHAMACIRTSSPYMAE